MQLNKYSINTNTRRRGTGVLQYMQYNKISSINIKRVRVLSGGLLLGLAGTTIPVVYINIMFQTSDIKLAALPVP